jgi:hypothetical protein
MILKMEAVCSSEMLVSIDNSTRRYTTEKANIDITFSSSPGFRYFDVSN